MPLDMSKYLGLFLSESSEHLEHLSNELVRLEKEKSPDAVDSMFRHAHSVKGMAASMGFEQIATLAHRVEDIVDQVRKQPQRMSADIADVLLAATDHLQAQVRAVGAGEAGPDASALIARLGEQLASLSGSPPPPTRVMPGVTVGTPAPPLAAAAPAAPPATEPPAVRSAPPSPAGAAPPASAAASASGNSEVPAAGRLARFGVRVKIAPACPVPGVRAFLVHKKLCALGNVFDLQPALDDLKAGRIPEGLLTMELELQASAGQEAIEKALAVVADLVLVEVARIEAKAAPVAAPRTEAPEAARAAVGAEPARTVRVKTDTLDYFLDAAGELLLATAHLRNLSKTLPESSRPLLEEGVDRLHAIVKDLHNKVMSVRMTPLALITDRLPRAARDIARKKGREVDLVIAGAEIELDRAILDELADPLLHILRNCIDHGLEDLEARAKAGKGPRGRIAVTARRDRDRVLVEIEDDGRGMDVGRLKQVALERGLITAEAAASMSDKDACMLACMPGVSTAQSVTDVSGRGVGMDAVKRAVENVGGSLDIDSSVGRGTRFTLRLPLTVAVVNVLLVGVGGEVYGLPIAKVKAVVEADPTNLSRSRNAPMLSWSGGLLPAHALGKLLQVPANPAGGVRPHVLLEADGGAVALEVDRLLGQEEAVLKPLSGPLDLIAGLAGVTILGTGQPIFILDVPRLIAA